MLTQSQVDLLTSVLNKRTFRVSRTVERSQAWEWSWRLSEASMQFFRAIGKALLKGFKGRDYAAEFDDETFYRSHYAATTIPREIPIRVRKVLVKQLGSRWFYVKPEDCVIEDDEIDFAELMKEMGGEFGVSIPDEDLVGLDASFDSLVRYLAGRIKQPG